MDEKNKKDLVASLVIGSLGLGALYLFKEDFHSLLRDINSEKEERKREENKSVMVDNFYDFYANMSEGDKLRWRRSVVKRIATQADKMFVYVDSKTLSQIYTSQDTLKYTVNMYSMNALPFEKLYEEYRKTLKEIFNIQ